MKGRSGQGNCQNTFPGLQKQGEMKAEWDAAQAPVGEGGRRSPLRGTARVWGGKNPFGGQRVFVNETHPSSVCSWFASQSAKPSEKRESRQWDSISVFVLSTALVKKLAAWFICCVGILEKPRISLYSLSSCSELPCHWEAGLSVQWSSAGVVGSSPAWLWEERCPRPRAVPASGLRECRGFNLTWTLVIPPLSSTVTSRERA